LIHPEIGFEEDTWSGKITPIAAAFIVLTPSRITKVTSKSLDYEKTN
jgi:hypothetical protein